MIPDTPKFKFSNNVLLLCVVMYWAFHYTGTLKVRPVIWS